MSKNELIEKKLRADEAALGLIAAEGESIYDYANAVDEEICALEAKLEKLKGIYEVYNGFCELGLSTRREVGDAVCSYAVETAKNGADGYRVLDLLYNASLDGSEKAVMEYARILAYGLYGVAPSVEEAADWLEKYAEKGSAEACYSIAVLHFDFPSVIEAQKAYDYCQKAASLGYYPAIRRLSQPFDLRTYTEKLIDKANKGNKNVYFELFGRYDLAEEERAKYLALALENGDAEAEFAYADSLLQSGKTEEAKEYFEKAGLHGSARAYMRLARLAIPEAGEPYCDYFKLDVTLLPTAYHKTEFEYYKKAAALGDTGAMVYVGIAYKQGYPASRNYGAAYDSFAKAVELGDEYLAPHYLAECYEKGNGAEKDEHAAVMYYAMSAERGNTASMLALARIYGEGLGGIEKNAEAAAKYLFMSGTGRD
ncbi:MAG: sel1 repeat family protein [Clostridia bacterium]|nr:sel1 repeat family protein [Clostridia bacterium]